MASAHHTSPEYLQEQFQPQLLKLCAAVSPSVISLLSYFAGLPNREIPHSARRGTGVFVEPRLIVTSARVVARISTVRDSESGSTLHKCYFARTIAVTFKEKVFRTTPAAVNFARNIAVLRVVIHRNERRSLPPPCAVARSAADEDGSVFVITRHDNCTVLTTTLPGFRKRGEISARPKAPWPLDDEVEWSDFGACEKSDAVVASQADVSGSPWFNFGKEVIGIASWAAEAADGRLNSYAVPPSCIRSMVNYAKTKGPNDPIVMDPWINAHIIPDNNSNVIEECVPSWTKNIVVQMYM